MGSRRARAGDDKIAVAYLRASTDDQRLSPEAQRAAIDAWAASEGVSIVGWFVDSGVSGGADLADRPALVAAVSAIRDARAGVLVVARRDRLARDVAVAALVERAVAAVGARIATADGIANGSAPADGFLRSVLDAASQYERGLIRARTRAALQAKKARGERAGTVPFGFCADAAGRLHADTAEQRVIARVRELRASGCSIRQIAREAGAMGLLCRSGRPLPKTTVERILARAP